VTVASTVVHGSADEGWGNVFDAFRRNFDDGLEDGAACCVYLDGRPVVDVWAGTADVEARRPWGADTIVVLRSGSKGAAAICAHMLVEWRQLDLDARVTRYWPEYGAVGKHDTRVRWLLCHEAGVPAVDRPLTLDDACAWEPVIRALEEQRPLWVPGTRNSYHPMTWGFLVGEVVRRVAGKTLGTFFADEVAAPLSLSAWIGLPTEQEPRVAPAVCDSVAVEHAALVEAVLDSLGLEPDERRLLAERLRELEEDPNSVTVRASTLSGAFADPWKAFQSRRARAAEFPSSNLITDARSLARMYAATVGEVDGIRLLASQTVDEICSYEPTSHPFAPPGLEPLAGLASARFLLGFLHLPCVGPRSFGHTGRGGSLGLADPDVGIGFGYVMNRMSMRADDPRVSSLLGAVAANIGDDNARPAP
jgi:CubicO group peptidase (beta-lactamase class C family)